MKRREFLVLLVAACVAPLAGVAKAAGVDLWGVYLPKDRSVVTILVKGRIILLGATMANPENWYASSIDDPTNWDYEPTSQGVFP